MRKLSEIDVNGKRVLMRLDLNVPLKDGKITSDARIQERCRPSATSSTTAAP